MKVTNAQIRRLKASLRDGTITDAIGRHMCSIALGGRGQLGREPTAAERNECRARITRAIADRARLDAGGAR